MAEYQSLNFTFVRRLFQSLGAGSKASRTAQKSSPSVPHDRVDQLHLPARQYPVQRFRLLALQQQLARRRWSSTATIRSWVTRAGFEAVEAANAAQAIEILESRMDIRVVFSDIDMPEGIDGVRLAAIIRDRWPEIEIILTSGFVEPSRVELPTRGLFFSKPYDEQQVITAMRKFAA